MKTCRQMSNSYKRLLASEVQCLEDRCGHYFIWCQDGVFFSFMQEGKPLIRMTDYRVSSVCSLPFFLLLLLKHVHLNIGAALNNYTKTLY